MIGAKMKGPHLINLLAASLVVIAGCKDLDKFPPKASVQLLTFTNVTANSLDVGWTGAADEGPIKSDLKYSIYYSTAKGGVMDINGMKSNGTLVGSTIDQSFGVNDLSEAKTYYFNVLATDQGGNELAYQEAEVTTADVTAPTPGGEGWMYLGIEYRPAIKDYMFYLQWLAASDNGTPQAELEYKLFGLKTGYNENLIPDASDAVVVQYFYDHDQLGKTWTVNLLQTDLGVIEEVLGYFVLFVAVRDKTGNIGMYYAGYSDTPLKGKQLNLSIQGKPSKDGFKKALQKANQINEKGR